MYFDEHVVIRLHDASRLFGGQSFAIAIRQLIISETLQEKQRVDTGYSINHMFVGNVVICWTFVTHSIHCLPYRQINQQTIWTDNLLPQQIVIPCKTTACIFNSMFGNAIS